MRSLPMLTLLAATLLRTMGSWAEEKATATDPATDPAPLPDSALRGPLPEPSEPAPEKPAPDTLDGHLSLALAAGVEVPRGRLGSEERQSNFLKAGIVTGVEAAYGISRTVALGVWGDSVWYQSGGSCQDCAPSSFALGGTVRYHLVQGTRFDPWISAGLGFRSTTIPVGGSDRRYAGPELLRLVIGGDWYATSLLGFGPTLELDAGTFTTRPSDAGDAHLFWDFQAKARVTFDIPGK